MTKKQLMSLSKTNFDSTVQIAGTNFDRRRKVTNDKARKMNQMVAAGKSYSTIAKHFGVSPYAVRYNTDPDFASVENAKRVERGFNPSKSKKNTANRIAYKKKLIESGKKLNINA